MANNFFRHPSCKALWRFESGALTADSISTNTLTPTASPPTADTTNFWEGSSSALFTAANDQGYSITDADLANGFPLKSGDTAKKITIAFWYLPVSQPASDKIVIGKWQASALSFALDHFGSTFSFGWATSNTNADWTWTNIFNPVTGHPYHIAIVLDGVAKTAKLRIYDSVTLAVNNYTHTYGSALNVSTAPFFIGGDTGGNTVDGNLDEVVVFKCLLADGEIDAIRNGTFASSANNFLSDSSCKALWRLEPAALTADSISTNTLTNTSVLEDTTNYKEGTGGALFDASAFRALEISDANLVSGFPCKNGDTVKVGTWSFWFRPTATSGGLQDLVCKGDWSASKRTLATYLNGTTFTISWGNNALHQEFSCGTVANNKWYHVGISFDGVTKVLQVHVYNATDDTILYSGTSFPTTVMAANDGEFAIGRHYNNTNNRFVGQIDEVVVFNRFLQTREIDTIRNGLFQISNKTTDFSEYTTGQAPNDWTERWNAADGSLNISDTGVIGGKCLQVTSSTSRYAASWDVVGTPRDVEVLAKVKGGINGSEDAWRIILRGGYNNNIIGYMAYGRHSYDEVRVGYYNDSTTFVEVGTVSVTLTHEVYYWVRFRIIGTSIKCKVWEAGTAEPSSWGLDATDSTISAGGWVMVGDYTSANYATFDWFAVAVNGAVTSVPETGNFYSDPTCKARWRFESGAFINDSQGKNALTAINTPTADGTNRKEGFDSAALVRASSQYFTIPDIDLSPNFPFKSTGNNQVGTYCCWVKLNTAGATNQGFMGKLRTVGGAGMFFYNNLFYLEWNNGWQSTGIAATTGEWYHVTCRMDGPNGYSDLIVFQASNQQTSFYSKGDWGALPICYADFRVGAFNDPATTYLDGNIDEALVFNRFLTSDEIIAIRNGVFGGIVPPLNDFWHNGAPWPMLGWNDGSELYWHNGAPLKPLADPEAATSDLAAILAPVTASITGNLDPTGLLSATLQKITASGTGETYGTTKVGKVGYTVVYNVLNEIRAGKVGYTVVYSTESEAEPVTGDLAATIQALTADIDGYAISNIGGLHATLANIQAHINAVYTIPDLGVLNATLARITASISGVHFSLPDTFDLTLEVSRRVRYYKKT